MPQAATRPAEQALTEAPALQIKVRPHYNNRVRALRRQFLEVPFDRAILTDRKHRAEVALSPARRHDVVDPCSAAMERSIQGRLRAPRSGHDHRGAERQQRSAQERRKQRKARTAAKRWATGWSTTTTWPAAAGRSA